MVEVKQTTEYFEVDGENSTYRFGKEELRCKSCGSGHVKADHQEEFDPDDPDAPVDTPVPVMSLATTCKQCGETALHISY